MAARIKIADGKYCYAGPTCRLHSPTGIQAAKTKLVDAFDLYTKASSLDEMAKAKEALNEATIAYDATPEGRNALQGILDTTPSNNFRYMEAVIRAKEADAYSEKVEAEFKVASERNPLAKKAQDKYDPNNLIDLTLNRDLSLEAVQFEEEFAPTVNAGEGYMGSNEFIGAKKTKGYVPLKDTRAQIRKDIARAIEVGYLPANLKYSVNGSQGYSEVNVTVQGLKDSSIYTVEPHPQWPTDTIQKPTDDAKELKERLGLIANAYKYDNSNGMVDYFNSSYYAKIELETEKDRAYRQKTANETKERAAGNKSKKEFISSFKTNPNAALNSVAWLDDADGDRKVGRVPGTKLFVIDQGPNAMSGVSYTYLVNLSGNDIDDATIGTRLLKGWKTNRTLRSKAERLI